MTLRSVFEEVNHTVKELSQKVREVSKRQKDLWQQVPFLALQADGRTGYSDQYARAYIQGYWAVESSVSGGCYSVYVDIETGELVSAYDPRQVARDKDVINLAVDPQQLDASHLVKALKVAAKEPIGSYYDAKKRKERKERITSILRRGNITQNHYRRTINPKEVYGMNALDSILDTLG
ncbi:MAG: hypothetical protein Q7S34_00285 [bacterium]|nr:hypothetical protein [bacterium]